jgi:Helicase associated domain
MQRSNSHAMPPERGQRLDAIDFIWDRLEEAWEEGFAALMTFKAREGHCRVPKVHIEGTFKLGQGVDRQRQPKTKMSPERTQRLHEIGFVWDPHESAWEEGFAALTTFKTREGHCRVPQLHIEGAFKLGAWVARQRATKDRGRRVSPRRPWSPVWLFSGTQCRFNGYRVSISELQPICWREHHVRKTIKKVRKQYTDGRLPRKLGTAGR